MVNGEGWSEQGDNTMEHRGWRTEAAVLDMARQVAEQVGMPGVLVTGLDGCIVFCNALAAQLLDIKHTNAEGRQLLDVVPTPICIIIQQALRDGQRVRALRQELASGGRIRHVSVSTDRVHSPETGELLAVAVIRDLDELVAVEQQLHEAQRLAAFGQMAAGAVHELRNPLTTVRGFVQLFARAFIGLERADEARLCDTVLSELDRASRLLSELLFLSRPGSGSTVLDLAPVINETVGLLTARPDAPQTQLELAPLRPVRVNPERIRQVVANLWQNAADAVGRDGRIRVVASCQSDQVTVEVNDEGPGLAPTIVPHLFEPFVTTKDGGTGLGLVICRRIIEDFGGTLTVSDRPTGGVCARFSLPLDAS